MLEHIAKPLVIEVETPDNELSIRRIGFYRRNGMRLWEGYDYMQPPYRPAGNALPMLLMSSGDIDPQADYTDVVSTIHRKVYGVCE